MTTRYAFENMVRARDWREPGEYWEEEMPEEMNTCKTCKHWQGNRDKAEWNTFGKCPVLMDPTDSQSTYLFEPQIICNDDADADSVSMLIETHANFGCVLWVDRMAMETR